MAREIKGGGSSRRLSETPTSRSKETVEERNSFEEEREGEGRETTGNTRAIYSVLFFSDNCRDLIVKMLFS